MKLSRISQIVILVVLLILTCVPAVYADWGYPSTKPDPYTLGIDMKLSIFVWDGSEDLPDDVQGENHAWLIYNIVNGEGVGLNTSGSEINDRIEARKKGGIGWREGRDYFGSMAITGGDKAAEVFDAKSNGLDFIIHAVSDNEYYVYTTSVYLGERGEINFWGTSNKTPGKPSIPIGEAVYPVYQTKVTRENSNSEWKIIETKRGAAPSAWYDENRSAANATQIPSFDVHNWYEIELGGKDDNGNINAIWTFVGDDPTAYATKELTHVYYKISPKTAGTYTVWSENLDVEIRIISSDGTTPISTSSTVTQTDGTQIVSASWSASASLYYIEITGDDVMQFHVS